MIIQIVTAVFLFLSRVLLLLEDKNGWIISIIGGSLSLIYLAHSELYIYLIAQTGFVIMSIYGLVHTKYTISKQRRKQIFFGLSLISIIIALLITIYLPNPTYLLQSICSIIIMWSAYFIADKKPLIGWISYVIGNSIFAYISLSLGQQFFGHLQIATVILAICGVYKNIYTKPRAV